jgi:serine/threonine-protein kinase
MNSGRMIGHYRIVELLGSGAMGTVQVAVDTYIDRPVAIKSLRPELTQDPDFVSRFRGEAKSLARLNHPNIATLFSPILDGAELHLVMELVQGKALDDILRDRGKPLGVKESLAITAQAADGLSYAHEMGVIHRDIKPANLMIANDGRVKIMDFGIARVQGSVRLTRSGTAVGTPLYMSPEQCRGGEGDERSDIYSLAMVLYEMLSGAPPFKFDTEYDLIQAQITATPTPLVPKIAGVTPTLEAAIMTALAKRPEQRFQTMRAFSDAIGATALRPDATGVIRNATHLIEVQPEAEQEAKKTSALDVAQSRALYVSRRWGALGAPAKATVAVGAVAIVAFAVILLKPSGGGERVAPPAIEQSGLAAPAAGETIRDLRLAISGSATSAIKASDFDYVPNGVKLRELPAARALAATGDAEAQFALGMLLSETPGSVDKAGAFAAFRRAAEKNYPDAQVNLAVMYQNGVAPDGRDLAKASEWFAKAAEQGNGKALFWMGCYYQFGWGGLSQDSKRAIDQFSKAVAVRYAKATDALQAINNPGAPSPCK